MKKLLILTVFLLILLPSSKVFAFEEPIAGISPALTAYETYIDDIPDKGTETYIETYSLLFGVDSDLVRAVINGESDGNPKAYNRNRNGSHDRGLMQINSCNFKWLSEELGITDFYDPRQNIKAGCYMLGQLSRRYDNMHRVLMSYNMGERKAKKLFKSGTTSSKYSRKAMRKFNQLKGEMNYE
jgi:soluble lytic murein transglycosylase-like protein